MEHGCKCAPEEWKELVAKLPSVISAEFVLNENDTIRELHVLSGMDRSAKQIVRDIQSAMLARFGVDIDHRTISVAQIPQDSKSVLCSLSRGGERLICSGVDISIRSDECHISVELLHGDDICTGRADGGPSAPDRRRAAAEAAVNAVSSYLGTQYRLRLDEIRSSVIAGVEVVLVAVSLSGNGKDELLIGACLCREEESISAVRATLDAINRKLSILC